YPYRRREGKSFKINTGEITKVADHLFIGPQPVRARIIFLKDSAQNGKIDENPYEYLHCGVAKLVVHSGGQQFPSYALEQDFESKGSGILSYNSMYSGMGRNFGI